ncbi:unnamed protein product [Prunus brigantina]
MTRNVELLVDVRTNITGKVQMPTGDLVNVVGMGSLVVDTNNGRKYVREVMYLPGLKENLLSVGQMDEHGYFLVFGDGMCSLYDGPSLETLVMKVKKKVNRCYPLALLSENRVVLKASVTQSTKTWHRRLGHLHIGGLKQLRDKEMVHGLPQLEDYNGVCEGCQFGKQHREEFPRNQAQRATAPLELIHVDLCGPMKNDSIAGNKYKSNAFNYFKKFKAMIELQSGFKIKCLRSDKGGDYKSSEFDLVCEKEGIQRQFTLAYTPQQNGVVERKNITVIKMAKSMLHEKRMPYFVWAEAVHTSVYILNRFERIHKLEPKSFKGVFLGYATCEKWYRVFDPLSKKLFLSRDIVFDEEAAWNWEENSESISLNTRSFIHGDISTGRSDRMVLSPTSSTLSPSRRVLSI